MATGIGSIKQAFVRSLRDISALKAAVGSTGFHEGIALVGEDYPYVVYNVAVTYRSRMFGTEGTLKTTIDVMAASNDQVEAHNLDQLILDGLEDASLNFSGIDSITPGSEPSTLLCHRLYDLSSVDLDEAGNKVYLVGGSYAIWTDRL